MKKEHKIALGIALALIAGGFIYYKHHEEKLSIQTQARNLSAQYMANAIKIVALYQQYPQYLIDDPNHPNYSKMQVLVNENSKLEAEMDKLNTIINQSN